MKKKGTKDLTLTQRRQLETLLRAGVNKKDIAVYLGVCLATVYNEINRGKCIQKVISSTDYLGVKHYKQVSIYCADVGERNYRLNQSAHGAPLKIGNDFSLIQEIENRVINDKISACAALGAINRQGLARTIISKTTLYRYIRSGYIFNRLTMKNIKIKARHYQKAVIKIPPKGTSIEKRPAEIAERNTFGHWEMDCVIGKKTNKDVLLAFTERLTRFEIIFKMPNRKSSTVVHYMNKLERRFGKRFRQVFKSITVDNGSEFANFSALEKSIFGGKRTNLYYCHPYTSCERGSNERLNREIRRLIPKGTDLALLNEDNIKSVEDWINSYPREIFDYATSAEKFSEYVNSL